MSVYPLGTQVLIEHTFYDENDVPTSPTEVVFTVERPDETVDTYTFPGASEVTELSDGVFQLAYVRDDLPGQYLYKAAGTDGLIAVSPVGSFTYVGDAISQRRDSGPCEPWTTEDEVAACCGTETDTTTLSPYVEAANELLFVASGGQFPGTCTTRVRPCPDRLRCLGPWHIWEYDHWQRGCSCRSLSRVPLAGYATGIEEVTIDGEVVDPDTYRLDEHLWLTRVPDPDDPDTRLRWPSCQDMDRPETDEGTFSVLYEFGRKPPMIGQLAARDLACSILATCDSDAELADGACLLPSGVTRLERLGVVIDLQGFTTWGIGDGGEWRTGIANVDAFLNLYARGGRHPGPPQVWSPDIFQFPRPVASAGS